MTEGELRAAMVRRFEAMSLREWCRLTGCNKAHVSEFVNGKKGPPSDMLNALNLEVRYIRRKAPIRRLTHHD
jgi:hypothetical protein